MDAVCTLTAILFSASNLIRIGLRITNKSYFNFELWKELDIDYIQNGWDTLYNRRFFGLVGGLLNAAAWFTLCVPVIEVAWILSKGGKRKLGVHTLMGTLAIGGGVAEILSHLMMVGLENVAGRMSKDFNLDDWVNFNDGTGWRVLEMTTMESYGLVLWVDAFEWLALFGVLLTIFTSARTEKEPSFGKHWANFGVFIAVLCLVDFLANIAIFDERGLFMIITIVISIANTLIFIPVWLLFLARQLPLASPNYLYHEPQDAPTEMATEEVAPVATIS
mmetsp:Transcript_21330/g.31247  ORF Transcript_21330/g.31247 Transcript_21330/m.31247 type:complete len:277 (+) Transcript_21330:176-1006(+)|eukprot:CAMPEP_0195507326 /NCGR_PEP_ID=MMETSP0794_2-20130614/796_1 /TAXON_ID=515487 /ORGANISM="Stephanopyxis turris, Strain CCMP 815" /LENGTH=276 /DNA_ID=CAMNT_0040633967 /DNA_START=169 /DNA_END=999 /DNA_ORIENTATION=+